MYLRTVNGVNQSRSFVQLKYKLTIGLAKVVVRTQANAGTTLNRYEAASLEMLIDVAVRTDGR